MTNQIFSKSAVITVTVSVLLATCLSVLCINGFSQNTEPAQSSNEELSNHDEFVDLFNRGLNEMDEDKGSTMISMALARGIKDPESACSFWRLLEKHLAKLEETAKLEAVNQAKADESKAVDESKAENVALKKVLIANLFLEQLNSEMDQCALDDFEPMWNLRNKVKADIQNIIDSETGAAIQLLESKSTDEIAKAIQGKTGADKDIKNALQTLALFDDLGISEKDLEAFEKIKKNVYNTLFDKLCSEYNGYAKRLEELKKETRPGNFQPVKEGNNKNTWRNGASYELLLKIRSFVQEYLSAEYLSTFNEYIEDKDKIQKLQNISSDGSDLLEKAVLLNQIRYNLWANWLIYNCSNDEYKAFASISSDFLIPAVAAMYEKKQSEILNETRPGDESVYAEKVQSIILADKVPLSAF